MATYQQLKRDPVSRVLFNNRITTMKGLQGILEDRAAFIALDTEHGPIESGRDRILYQVGLAYIPTLPATAPFPGRPRLGCFCDMTELRCLTLNINMSEETREDIIRFRGGVPNRRLSRFGKERQVDLDSLESAIVEFIQSCNPTTKVVLMGFEMPAEWTYLSRIFPSVIPYFSSWVDLRDIAKDVAAIGVIPGRVSVLQIFGYHWKDIKGSNRCGSADNAGNDAVSILAMANALLYTENQEKLRFCQKCCHIAHKRVKKSPCFLNEDKMAFGATIQSQKGSLPDIVNSGMKVARYFSDFLPVSAGLKSTEMAFITFACQDHLDQFIQTISGRLLPTGETLSASPIEGSGEAEMTTEMEEKRQLREVKKADKSESDFADFGNIFAEVDV
ncbi:hypothetical protein F5Y01DRAFT_328582 [Xylaria sp. FL0043]|nr:hypothetical protein F5Y01DRAFT_328582 [Xylaria sp. FL0043]